MDDAVALGDATSSVAVLRGGTVAAELFLGGTVASGLVVGGVGSLTWAPSPGVTSGSQPTGGSLHATLLALGPFVDWYPEPARGFHAGTKVGYGGLKFSASDAPSTVIYPDAKGIVVDVFAGHDWWVGEDATVGFLLRVEWAHATGQTEYQRAPADVTHAFVAPALLLSATWH